MSRTGDALPRAGALRPPGLVVELCGLPGAGKTTLAGVLVAALRGRGLSATVLDADVSAAVDGPRRVARRLTLAARAAGAVGDGFESVAPLAQLRAGWVLSTGQDRARDRLAVPLQWWATETLLDAARHHPGIRVAEEGLVQTWWTACLRSRTDTAAVAALPVPVRPDVVVHVRVPVEVALQRLASRASRHSRVQQLPEAERRAELDRGEQLLATLLAAWSRRGLAPVRTVDATDSGPDALDAVVDVLATDLVRRAGTLPRAATR